MNTEATRRQFVKLVGGGVAGSAFVGLTGCSSGSGNSSTRLRLSHQWPEASSEKGDYRALIAQKFAERVEERTNGEIAFRIYPNASLVDAEEQYKAITKGTLDMSVFPLGYAEGDVPQFSITELPCIVPSHAKARNWRTAEIGQRLEEISQENGVKILIWNWDPLCLATTQGDPVVQPKDVRAGSKWRGATRWKEKVLAALGASITSMPSSEIYSALQTGVLDGLATSPSSYRSYRLYEQTKSYTSPSVNTIGFAFEPLIIGVEQFERLPPDIQTVFEEEGKSLQEFAETAAEADDETTEQAAKKAGVNVAHIDDAAYEEWRRESEPFWEQFASEVKGGRRLVDLALKASRG